MSEGETDGTPPPPPPPDDKPELSRSRVGSDVGGGRLTHVSTRRLEPQPVAMLSRHLTNDALIGHLQGAIGKIVGQGPPSESPIAFVRADHPVIALAAALLCGVSDILTLSDSARATTDGSARFDDLFRRFPRSYFDPFPALPCSGPIAIARFFDEVTDAEDREAHVNDLIATASALRKLTKTPLIFLTNVTGPINRLKDETGGTIPFDLHDRMQPLIEALLPYTDIRRELHDTIKEIARNEPTLLIRRLDSKNYVRLRHLADDRLAKDRGVSPDASAIFEKYVLNTDERFPRHTAAIYIATHFAQIAPADFVEVAGQLIRNTPAWTPPERDSRPPAELTDVVLDECRIRLDPKFNEARFVNSSDAGAATDPEELRAEIKKLFRERAPLLLEQYLMALALQMTLGHPSEEVADQYAVLEIDSLTGNAGMRGPSAMAERLKRVIFGYAAVTSADEHYFKHNADRNRASLDRALARTPRLLRALREKIATPGSPATIRDILVELCAVRPLEAESDRWATQFDEGTVKLFWSMFGQEADISLHDFPALRRYADPVLRARGQLFFERFRKTIQDGDLSTGLQAITETPTLGRLVFDLGTTMPKLDPIDQRPVRLLYVAATKLAKDPALITGAIAGEARGEDVHELARALFSRDVTAWIVAPEPDLEDEAALHGFVTERWHAAGAGLNILTGIAAYGEVEPALRSFWLADEANDGNFFADDFNDPQLWRFEAGSNLDFKPEQVAGATEFRQALRKKTIVPLLDAVRFGVLISATTRKEGDGTDIVFDKQLRSWLRSGAIDGITLSPAAEMLKRLEECRALALRWDAFRPRITTDARVIPSASHHAAAAAFRDRQVALTKFARALNAVQQAAT